jgi:hypothetical protein
MIRIARERWAGIANVAFEITSGRSFGNQADRSFDLVLAVQQRARLHKPAFSKVAVSL